MPLFTAAGSASLLSSKTARVCFHQLSFPTFSNAEVPFDSLRPVLSTKARGRSVRSLVQDFTASRLRLCLPVLASRLPAVRLWLSRATSLCLSHLLGTYQEGTGPILAAPPCPPLHCGETHSTLLPQPPLDKIKREEKTCVRYSGTARL